MGSSRAVGPATRGYEAIVFDFDGTLTTPGHIDFAAIRSDIGCPAELSILAFIDTLSDTDRRSAKGILDAYEMDAASQVGPAPGLEETVEYLKSHSIRMGILTRNTLLAVRRSLERITCCKESDFSSLITRDDNIPVKPDPAGVIETARRLGTKPDRVLVVGDYIYDIEAGRRAGATTVFLDALPDRHFAAPASDHVIGDLRSLTSILARYR